MNSRPTQHSKPKRSGTSFRRDEESGKRSFSKGDRPQKSFRGDDKRRSPDTERAPKFEKSFGGKRGGNPFHGDRDRKPARADHDHIPFHDDGEQKPRHEGRDRKPFRNDRERKPFGGDRERGIFRPDRDRKSFGTDRGGRKPSRDNRDRKPERNLPPPPARERSDSVLIWGLHAARAAWLNPKRRCLRLWLTEAGQTSFAPTITEARDELLLKRPDAKNVERQDLDRLTPPGSVHQGIVVEVLELHEPALHELIGGDAPPDVLLMLDQVTDPHNVGAILRSVAAFGAGALILTERNAPTTTGVLAKSASGALEHVPQIHVVNLARALDELREAGYWCVGLAEEGERDMGALDLTGRTVLVLGAEGEGLRQLTRKKCDELARLPTGGPIGSLNVSNAAAVALYEIRRQKKAAS